MRQEKILSIILLAFSIEYLGYGELSVYRVIILPLSFYGLLNMKRNSVNTLRYNLFIVLFMLYFAFCSMMTDTNPLFAILCLPFMLYIGNSMAAGTFSYVNVARIFSLYSLPHIVAYLLFRQYAFLEEGRFNGLHEDSNFCGIYLLIAFAASALQLFIKKEQGKWKQFDRINCLVCLYLIVITGSRGAMLTCLLFLAFLLLKSNLRKIYKYIVVILVFIGYIFVNRYIESLPVYMTADDGYIDFVLSRFKDENMEGGSNRIEFWTWAFDAMSKEPPYVPVGTNFMGRVFYTHNSYVDLLLELGLIQGAIFVIFYAFNLMNTIRYILKPVSLVVLVMYTSAIVVSITLFLLSADRSKLFWMMFCFVIYRPTLKNTYNEQIYSFNNNPRLQR